MEQAVLNKDEKITKDRLVTMISSLIGRLQTHLKRLEAGGYDAGDMLGGWVEVDADHIKSQVQPILMHSPLIGGALPAAMWIQSLSDEQLEKLREWTDSETRRRTSIVTQGSGQ